MDRYQRPGRAGSCGGQQLAQSTHVKGGHFVLQRLVFYMQLIAASRRIALPLDVVLGLFLYQAYALQYVGDVIDPSLLHLHGSWHRRHVPLCCFC